MQNQFLWIVNEKIVTYRYILSLWSDNRLLNFYSFSSLLRKPQTNLIWFLQTRRKEKEESIINHLNDSNITRTTTKLRCQILTSKKHITSFYHFNHFLRIWFDFFQRRRIKQIKETIINHLNDLRFQILSSKKNI